MEYEIEATCKLMLCKKKGEDKSELISTDFYLKVSDNVDRDKLINGYDKITNDGHKTVTQCFVQGLIANIHSAHQAGSWNDAEHLRYIISELEAGFVKIRDTKIEVL